MRRSLHLAGPSTRIVDVPIPSIGAHRPQELTELDRAVPSPRGGFRFARAQRPPRARPFPVPVTDASIQVERRPGQPVRSVERMPGLLHEHGAQRNQGLQVRADGAAWESRRPEAPVRPLSASRAGASSGTDPRNFPTSTGSGRSVDTVLHWMRSVEVPAPFTVAPRPAMICSSTSTSRMRGTFSRTHSWSVSRQAAISGSAAFLFPSTVTAPESRRPPRSATLPSALRPFGLCRVPRLVGRTPRSPSKRFPRATEHPYCR